MTKVEAFDDISSSHARESPAHEAIRAIVRPEGQGARRVPVLELRAAIGTPIKIFGAKSATARRNYG